MSTPEERSKHAAYMREYLKRMPKAALLKKRIREEKWHKEHAARTKVAKQAWAARNRASLIAKTSSPEAKALRKEYRQSAAGKANKKRGKSKERGAIVSTLTSLEWGKIVRSYNGKCAYCQAENVKIEQEHIVPLSRGGNHDKDNVVPSCRKCNIAKGQRTAKEWADDIKRVQRKTSKR